MNEDEDAFRALDITEPHFAELLETGSRWQPILRELFHGLGKQDLPTPRHAEQARQTVERSGEIVAAPRFGFAGVQRHASAQGSQLVRPGLCQKRVLSSEGGTESGRCRGKRGLRSIA